jgi:hypothetical protein
MHRTKPFVRWHSVRCLLAVHVALLQTSFVRFQRSLLQRSAARAPPTRTGQTPSAPDNCPVRSSRTRHAQQRAGFHRTQTHRTNFPVRCSVRCSLSNTARLGFATGQTGHVTVHVRCPLSGAPSFSAAHAREHAFTGHEPPDKTRLSGALSGAPQRAFLNSFCHPCSQPLTPKCSITLCTCVSVFTNIFKGVRHSTCHATRS